jgi:hypothetical protein
VTSDALDDEDEILFRQIHPNFFEDGHVASSSFAPTAKDEGKLSVDRSSLTTASGAFALYTGDGHQSAAVFGIIVGEFGAENLPCHPDPIEATETQAANPAHAYAKYSTFTASQGKKIAKRLRNKAVKRGLLHRPD